MSEAARASIPRNQIAEEQVLACVFFNPRDGMAAVYSRLTVDDFYSTAHQYIYQAMRDMYDRNAPISVQGIIGELTTAETLEKAGGMQRVLELSELNETAAGLEDALDRVKNTSMRRKLILAATEIVQEVGRRSEEPFRDLLNWAQSQVFSLASTGEMKGYNTLETVMNGVFEQMENQMEYHRKGEGQGVTSGFNDLDNMTAGWQKGDLVILAARPSMGKTALALNMAFNAALHGKGVLVFSLEMPDVQLGQRLLCAHTRTPINLLRKGTLTDQQYGSLATSVGTLAESPLYICDRPVSVVEISSLSRQCKMANPDLGMVIIDYIQLIDTPRGPGMKNINREQEVARISRQLKLLAKELNIPIVALSQLNRGLESRTDKRPMLSDLRESGAIEQDADIVIFLYNEDKYKKNLDPGKPSVAEVIIAKHRNGPTGMVRLLWQGQYTRFDNYLENPFSGSGPAGD